MRSRIHEALLAAGLFVASSFVAISAVQAGPILELGALFQFNGTGASTGISGQIYDKDIHSGVPRLADGTLSDSYVLQGGDPFGGDTGDAFEVTQSEGHAVVAGFDIFTDYAFGNPPCAEQVGTCIIGGPDTGFLTFKNSTANVFTGILTLSGHAFGGIYGPEQDFLNSGAVTLAPGANMKILLNFESSNFGGYNHPDVCGTCGGVPEPSTWALLGLGLILSLGFARRRV